MVSRWQYTHKAKLEAHMNETLSALSSKFTDAAIDNFITQAELIVNGYVGASFTPPVPLSAEFEDIELVTNMISEILVRNWMIRNAIGIYANNTEIEKEILSDSTIVLILEKYRDKFKQGRSVWVSKKTNLHKNDLIHKWEVGLL